jgi:hypothetical protein
MVPAVANHFTMAPETPCPRSVALRIKVSVELVGRVCTEGETTTLTGLLRTFSTSEEDRRPAEEAVRLTDPGPSVVTDALA